MWVWVGGEGGGGEGEGRKGRKGGGNRKGKESQRMGGREGKMKITTTRVHTIRPCKAAVPCGLVVRIRRSHRRGRGSIPRMGGTFSFLCVCVFPFSFQNSFCCLKLHP